MIYFSLILVLCLKGMKVITVRLFVGNNPLHQKISEDVKEIFDAAKEIWKAEQLSGPNLLDFIEQQAKSKRLDSWAFLCSRP